MFKALVLAVAALAFGTSAIAQERHVVREETRIERHVEGSRHDRIDRFDRRDRHDRFDRHEVRRDRGHHYGHNRYHCHNVKKVVYRDGMRRVVYKKNCHSARH